MPKNKLSLVLQVALSDRENFKVLPTKKQQKQIFNRCRNRLLRQGLSGEALKFKLITEIQSELFKLQPEYKPKENNPMNEDEFFSKKEAKFTIKGTRIWSNPEKKIDPLDQLQKNYNETVKSGFDRAFCPRCKSNPCVCK